MESKIAEAIHLKHNPVAFIWSDEKPEKAIEFKPGKWGCIMWLAAAAAKGKTAVCGRSTFGCIGGGVGVGFGNQYKNFPGGMDGFYRFLSSGFEEWEEGRGMIDVIKQFLPKDLFDDVVHGEKYFSTPEIAEKFVEGLPMRKIPAQYVIFKPLSDVDLKNETPRSIIFFADADQVSALTVLANYNRESNDNVIVPAAAGCHMMGIFVYEQGDKDCQKAILGLTDLSARENIYKQLGSDFLSFAVPLKMFEEMEGNVQGSFLERRVWLKLLNAKKDLQGNIKKR